MRAFMFLSPHIVHICSEILSSVWFWSLSHERLSLGVWSSFAAHWWWERGSAWQCTHGDCTVGGLASHPYAATLHVTVFVFSHRLDSPKNNLSVCSPEGIIHCHSGCQSFRSHGGGGGGETESVQGNLSAPQIICKYSLNPFIFDIVPILQPYLLPSKS